MSITTTLVVVILFTVLIGGLFQRYVSNQVVLSDVEYLIVGLVLGPLGLSLLDDKVMQILQPFVSLTLGFVGFALGITLRHRLRVSASLEAGLLSALMTVVVTAGAFFWLFQLHPFAQVLADEALWVAIILGSTAAASSMQVVERSLQVHRAKGPAANLLRTFSLSGSVVAVLVSGSALALSRATQASNHFGLTKTEWIVAATVLGVACGLLFALFMGRAKQESDDRLFLASVGVITFGSGVAMAAGMSPLLLNALSGLIVSIFSKDATALHRTLSRLERPATLTLLIFAAALWRPISPQLWVLPALFFLARLLILRGTAPLALRVAPALPGVHRLGHALLAPGAIAVAIAVNYGQVYPNHSALVLSTVLAAVFVGGLVSPPVVRSYLNDAGEMQEFKPNRENKILTRKA